MSQRNRDLATTLAVLDRRVSVLPSRPSAHLFHRIRSHWNSTELIGVRVHKCVLLFVFLSPAPHSMCRRMEGRCASSRHRWSLGHSEFISLTSWFHRKRFINISRRQDIDKSRVWSYYNQPPHFRRTHGWVQKTPTPYHNPTVIRVMWK